MKYFCGVIILLSAFTAAAQNLTCRRCPIGLLSTCFFGDEVACNNSTQSCFRGEAQFNSTSLALSFFGCVDSDLCGTTLTGDFFGADYTASFDCCSTNLCNAATSVKLSLALAVLAAIVTSL